MCEEMAEMLAKQYASDFSSRMEPVKEGFNKTNKKLHNINFNKDDIAAIDELKTNSAARLQRYPAILLAKCKYPLTKSLFILWNYRSHLQG